MSTKKTPRPLYSQRWLARYGQGLKREEIRLLQGYRGLPLPAREALQRFVNALVLDQVTR